MRQLIAPYILAGGQSSRMGRDKAMIVFEGRTLLSRAVETARSAVHSALRTEVLPGASTQQTRVTVIGQRTLLEGADRIIPDTYAGCGPLGGIEAALGDLVETMFADWALFLPVDMPFLPSGLIEALLKEWIRAGQSGAWACYVVVDGRPQPLVSLLHRELHPFLVNALVSGQFRVTPVLQSACNAIASQDAGAVLSTRSALWQTPIKVDRICPIERAWSPTQLQSRSRPLWFANLNSAHDVREAETFLCGQGSMNRQTGFPMVPDEDVPLQD